MATRKQAIIEAVQECERWMGGAVVVTDGAGWYDAIPGAYLTDISYTGPREAVWRVTDTADAVGQAVDVEDAAEVEAVAALVEQSL